MVTGMLWGEGSGLWADNCFASRWKGSTDISTNTGLITKHLRFSEVKYLAASAVLTNLAFATSYANGRFC